MIYSLDAKPNYQMWDEEAFQSDIYVRSMTWLEKAIYKNLLTSAWIHSTRPDLPTNPDVLWRLSCDNRKMWDEHGSVPLSMFILEDRGDQEVYYQNRLRRDWEHLTEVRESYVNRGKKGAETRYAKNLEEPTPAVKQKELNPFNVLPEYCRRIFKRGTEKTYYFKEKLKELMDSYGGTRICDCFDSWASAQSEVPEYPVRAFLKVAESYLQDKVVKDNENPVLEALCTSLYHIGKQTFTGKNREGLNNLLSDFSFHEIERAYKEFVQDKDEYDIKFAAKNFSEGAGRTVLLAQRETEKKERNQAEFLEAATKQARESVQQIKEEEIEDTL